MMDPEAGDDPERWWQPMHSFNVIAGTSTGSILALYFARGRSNMSIQARLVLESIWDTQLGLTESTEDQEALVRRRAEEWIEAYTGAQVSFQVCYHRLVGHAQSSHDDKETVNVMALGMWKQGIWRQDDLPAGAHDTAWAMRAFKADRSKSYTSPAWGHSCPSSIEVR